MTLEVLAEHILLALPDLKRLEDQLAFTHEQKIAIWRRDSATGRRRWRWSRT